MTPEEHLALTMATIAFLENLLPEHKASEIIGEMAEIIYENITSENGHGGVEETTSGTEVGSEETGPTPSADS